MTITSLILASGFRGVRRLHRNDRGNMATLLLLTVFALVAMIGMIVNTSTAIDSRMRMQVAADTAAFTAVAWDARATNLVTGANMAIVRTASAEALGLAAIFTTEEIAVRLIMEARRAAILMLAVATFPQGVKLAMEVANELWLLGEFVAETWPAMGDSLRAQAAWLGFYDGDTYDARIQALFVFQKQVVDSLPGVVDAERKTLADYYNCDIRFATAHEGEAQASFAPVRRSDHWLPMVSRTVIRAGIDREGWANSSTLRGIKHGQGVSTWNRWALICGGGIGLKYHRWAHELVTQHKLSETGWQWRVSDEDRREYFTVIAGAIDHAPPSQTLSGMVFTRAQDRVPAIAQAEIFNGYEGLPTLGLDLATDVLEEADTGLGGVFKSAAGTVGGRLVPWRVWTTHGFGWRPRLASTDALQEALQADPEFRHFFEAAGVQLDGATIEQLSRH